MEWFRRMLRGEMLAKVERLKESKIVLCRKDYMAMHIARERNCFGGLLPQWTKLPRAELQSVAVFCWNSMIHFKEIIFEL